MDAGALALALFDGGDGLAAVRGRGYASSSSSASTPARDGAAVGESERADRGASVLSMRLVQVLEQDRAGWRSVCQRGARQAARAAACRPGRRAREAASASGIARVLRCRARCGRACAPGRARRRVPAQTASRRHRSAVQPRRPLRAGLRSRRGRSADAAGMRAAAACPSGVMQQSRVGKSVAARSRRRRRAARSTPGCAP